MITFIHFDKFSIGSFARWDTNKFPESPPFGFKAGKYLDGSTVFVGFGDNRMCEPSQFIVPGRLNAVERKVYMGCIYGEKTDSTTLLYIIDHPKLEWVKTNITRKESNVLQLAQYYIGRRTLEAKVNNQVIKYQQIGKVLANYFFCHMLSNGIDSHIIADYEVLVCKD
jgi:hypothetical protein